MVWKGDSKKVGQAAVVSTCAKVDPALCLLFGKQIHRFAPNFNTVTKRNKESWTPGSRLDTPEGSFSNLNVELKS